jgi:hypothetical protein
MGRNHPVERVAGAIAHIWNISPSLLISCWHFLSVGVLIGSIFGRTAGAGFFPG